MKAKLPNSVIQTLQKLTSAGFQAYIVGGAVRDILQGKVVHDWDFTTDARPEEIQKLFPGSFYDNAFGTVGIPIKKREVDKDNESVGKEKREQDEENSRSNYQLPITNYDVYEVTTFRTEQGYSDRRRPDKVEWGETLEEDLSRRDFTINAMALMVKSTTSTRSTKSTRGTENVEAEHIDPYDGQEDLQNKVIRAVGDPNERFGEDALRMMRAIRLGAELGFTIEPKTLDAVSKNKELIKEISWERIGQEFMKIVGSPYPADGVLILNSTGLLGILIPELTACIGIDQAGHHKHDVFTHSIESLRFCPSKNPLVRLATLLHDIGKPQSLVIREGKPTFYNHEVYGARIAKTIADRLRLSADARNFLWKLVRWHMFAYNPEMTDSAIRRFMRHVGKEDIKNMMDLRTGDRLGGGSRETSWRLEELKKRIEGLMHDPLTVADLKVDGHDVMTILKIKPGPMIGKVLNALFEEILEDPKKNEREYLLGRIPQVSSA